ncbi:MAG TPA: hypothetical protein DCE44_18445 [Verrucomicrobiales bacterium]|nr:hypothetical protein [Verrucomicrobiales bacterium]
MNPADAAKTVARAAPIMASARSNPNEKDLANLAGLGTALAALATQVPEAAQTRIVALSFQFLWEISPPPKNGKREPTDRLTVSKVCALTGTENLALVEVLKWPFCVGEAQKLVLAELEHRTHRKFDGNVWKFVEQADSLGIAGLNREFLERPARRPQITNAIAEVQHLRPQSKK